MEAKTAVQAAFRSTGFNFLIAFTLLKLFWRGFSFLEGEKICVHSITDPMPLNQSVFDVGLRAWSRSTYTFTFAGTNL